jgi:hypothetical protein
MWSIPFLEKWPLNHLAFATHEVAHELPKHLGGRFSTGPAGLHELLAEFLFDTKSEAGIFEC